MPEPAARGVEWMRSRRRAWAAGPVCLAARLHASRSRRLRRPHPIRPHAGACATRDAAPPRAGRSRPGPAPSALDAAPAPPIRVAGPESRTRQRRLAPGWTRRRVRRRRAAWRRRGCQASESPAGPRVTPPIRVCAPSASRRERRREQDRGTADPRRREASRRCKEKGRKRRKRSLGSLLAASRRCKRREGRGGWEASRECKGKREKKEQSFRGSLLAGPRCANRMGRCNAICGHGGNRQGRRGHTGAGDGAWAAARRPT